MRRECFYRVTVITTFALGTAAGDLTATTLGLGYLAPTFLFTGIMVIPAVAYGEFGLNEVAAFWFASIVTRPLEASVADWLAVSHRRGGGAWGPGTIGLLMAILIVACVPSLTVTHSHADAALSRSDGR